MKLKPVKSSSENVRIAVEVSGLVSLTVKIGKREINVLLRSCQVLQETEKRHLRKNVHSAVTSSASPKAVAKIGKTKKGSASFSSERKGTSFNSERKGMSFSSERKGI